MKIGFIQFDISKNRNENINTIKDLAKKVNADIIVLPELSDCGYLFNNKEELLNCSKTIEENEYIKELKTISAQKQCAIIAGVAERFDGKLFNSAVILEKGEITGIYRKIHLSNYEKTLFDKGEQNNVFSVMGIKVGIQICFDLWFPEISREQILQGAQLLCVIANFGGETTYEIARIRAIENLTPLILCNRVGEEHCQEIDATFLGRSSIIDNSGNRLEIGNDFTNDVKQSIIELSSEKANVICDDFSTEMNFHYKNKKL